MSAFDELVADVAEHCEVPPLVVHKVLEAAARRAADAEMFAALSGADVWGRLVDVLERLADRPAAQFFPTSAAAPAPYPTVTVVGIEG